MPASMCRNATKSESAESAKMTPSAAVTASSRAETAKRSARESASQPPRMSAAIEKR